MATMRPIIEVESDQQTQVLLEDYKKFLEEKMSQLRDTMEFEFISMKDRILELESDRTKFKVKKLPRVGKNLPLKKNVSRWGKFFFLTNSH